jgi:hypothetical protein
MENKKHCNICNKDVSSTNWSKHLKTKRHLDVEQVQREVIPDVNVGNERSDEEVQIKYCGLCNIDMKENDWIKHLKSKSHKSNTNSIKDKLIQKVRSFNIKRLRKRAFQNIEFETKDYFVKKSEEALDGCFLTLRIIPKNDVDSVYVLVELPKLMFESVKEILEHKQALKLQLVLKGKFRKFHPASGQEKFEEITVPSKNKIILREDEIEKKLNSLIREIHETIESWDNNEQSPKYYVIT